MRLGGPVFVDSRDPEVLAAAHRENGYRAAYCPNFLDLSNDAAIAEVKRVYAQNDLVISEVGAWCNILAQNPEEARKNREYVKQRLALADALGARCCITIMGTHNPEKWFSHHGDNYTQRFFEEAVGAAREIIDAVNPQNTHMCFELMPFNFLDSADEYLRLIEAVDRPALATHIDAVNCITGPRLYYNNGNLARELVGKLGSRLASVHCKDLRMLDGPPSVMFEEVRIGQGNMNYDALLEALAGLDDDIPLMLEALNTPEDYQAAADALRTVAARHLVNL